MHLAYGVALGSAVEAQRLYQERYPNRCLPSRPMFTSIANGGMSSAGRAVRAVRTGRRRNAGGDLDRRVGL